MSLRLTDFGTFDEVRNIAYFVFTISNFGSLKDNKISRPFRYEGHIWKLQIRKKNGNLGMFVRWYGTKIGLETHVKCSCTTGLGFSVMNHFDTSQTIYEGDLNENDIFDRVGSGIGYGEVVKLEKLEKTQGYLVKDKLVVKLRLQIKSTTFTDKIQATLRPDRMFIRSLKFHFHGTDWSFILFPNGEHEEEEEHDTIVEEKATLYLSRDSIPDNPCLRHQAHFNLYVEGGPRFEVKQNFYENQSLVFGTGYLMAADKLRDISKSGVIRVGVQFMDIKPYFNFAYNLRSKNNEGIAFKDQRHVPWLFKLASNEEDGKNLACSLTIDPKATCKQIKSLTTRDKKLKATWHAKIINFQQADMSIDIWSEQSNESGLFTNAGECHCISFPINESQMVCDESPYLDDDLQSSVHISILNSNFIYDAGEVVMKIGELKEIASDHKQNTSKIARDYFMREQIWRISLEKVEEEKEDAIASKNESFEKQTTELKEKDLMINSLEEKLTVVESYVKSLETNTEEEIGEFNERSISKLRDNSKTAFETQEKMNKVFQSLKKLLQESSTDIVAVAPIGAFGQDTITKFKTEIDVVVFVKGEMESNLKNGDTASCLALIVKTLSPEESNEVTSSERSDVYFEDFQTNINCLQCKSGDFDLKVYPTKNWMNDGGYSAIYEATTGLTTDALQCFIVATSERQAQFVKKQDDQCKDLIRIVKVWREKIDWEDNCRPSSYLISLLIISAYNTLKMLPIVKTPLFLKEVLLEVGFLSQDEDLRIEWNEFYDPDDFPIDNPKTPFVRDPVLPSHNVAEFGDWSQFRNDFIAWVSGLYP